MGHLAQQIEGMIGSDGAKAVELMVASASKPASGVFATVISVLMLLVGALGLFAQLQDALNTVWEVQPKPGRGVVGFFLDRLVSLTMVFGTAFLLLVSLVVSAVISAVGNALGGGEGGIISQVIYFAVSPLVAAMLFAMMFRFLPDAKILWRDVWFGAIFTASLFTLGKYLIGLYLGKSGMASAFGAAGSLAALLIWVYYSAHADRHGSRLVPKPIAEAVTDKAREAEGRPRQE